MNYTKIKFFDVANGVGVRTSLFVSGCSQHCPGCFNQETWDYDNGNEFTEETMSYILDSMAPYYIDGLSVLGGEPLDPENVDTVFKIIKKCREVYPKKTIWLWTGLVFEDVYAKYRDILDYIDVVVDGPFMLEDRNIALRFRGSPNQRIIDIPKTLESGKVVIWNDGPILGTHYSEIHFDDC